MENDMEVPQKIKNRTTISCSNSTSEYLSEESENTNLKIYMYPYAKIWKQPKCPSTDKWTKKLWDTHTHTGEYDSTIKRNKSCHNMYGLWGQYAKWNNSYRERQIPYDLLSKRSKKTKIKLTASENRLVVARGGGVGEMGELFCFAFK